MASAEGSGIALPVVSELEIARMMVTIVELLNSVQKQEEVTVIVLVIVQIQEPLCNPSTLPKWIMIR